VLAPAPVHPAGPPAARSLLSPCVLRIVHVVGARPNFMKVAPVMRALAAIGAEQRLVHTGQHYDERMSDVFFEDLGLPEPDVHLGVGSGSHADQTARVMLALEKVLLGQPRRPDFVLVPGDVNSTLAAALVAAKMGIPVAHLEAGLRSWDRAMPEEVNRVVADHLADLLLTPTADADENLLHEGIPPERIVRVGNVMIDPLLAHLGEARARRACERFGLREGGYAVATLHRQSNVDDPASLARLVSALAEVARELPVLFPLHPRTRGRLAGSVAADRAAALVLCEPLGYLDFLSVTSGARLVLTDSGGLQEETTVLGIPCLTLRENTERPITVSEGTNTVVGTDPARIVAEARAALRTGGKRGRQPELWDGRTGERVAEALRRAVVARARAGSAAGAKPAHTPAPAHAIG
jgi:UDP-N-acetylglucosamine 2-epimerase (non-hydrolysing)